NARPVEGEVRGDVDVEEVDRLAALRLDDRRALPHRPAVVVAGRRDRERAVPDALVGPCACEGAPEGLLVCRQHARPRLALVAHDHVATPVVRLSRAARKATTSRRSTTSPYFASMS